MPGRFKQYCVCAVIFFMLVSGGCGLFNTRDAENPLTIRSEFLPPTSPDIVIQNLTSSIIQKNSENYVRCISQADFKFNPDARSLLLYGTIFQNWSGISEKLYMDNLISQTNATASSNLFISNNIINYITPDSAILTADYIVVFQHNRVNVPKSSTGNMRMFMKADENSYFYVNKWEDYRKNDTDFTWSELKANFSN